MALVAAFALAQCQCRAWFEYVASGQNPADALSRDGYDDLSVQEHVQKGAWVPTPAENVDWSVALRLTHGEILSRMSALGDASDFAQ